MSATETSPATQGGHAHDEVLGPDGLFGHATPGKLGMWLFLLSDAFSFGGLLVSYGVLRGGAEVWRHEGEPRLGINFTAVLTFLLICSSVTMVRAVTSAAEGKRGRTLLWLGLTALGGALFLTGQYQEYFGIVGPGLTSEGLVLGKSAYASTFYVITSFHALHVFSGVLYLLVTMARTAADKATANDVEVLGLFWHFVDLVWILVFTFVYLL